MAVTIRKLICLTLACTCISLSSIVISYHLYYVPQFLKTHARFVVEVAKHATTTTTTMVMRSNANEQTNKAKHAMRLIMNEKRREEILRDELDLAIKQYQKNAFLQAEDWDKKFVVDLSDHKFILIWVPPFGVRETYDFDKSICGNCSITYDRTKVADPSTTSVVFHFKNLSRQDLPKSRKLDQYYVWWSIEAPTSLMGRNLSLEEYDGFFNLTMTHRRDSDVYAAYDSAAEIYQRLKDAGSGNVSADVKQTISKKNKLATLVVSNTFSPRAKNRMKYIERLVEAGLKLDGFGAAFNNAVKSIDHIKDYKFYLALENSNHCKDYITEKVFDNAYLHGAVPVVRGASKKDYEEALPKGSYIFSEDFDNPKALVEYLNYLDKNDTAYSAYFKWRTENILNLPQYNRTLRFCHLCRIVHGVNIDNNFNNYQHFKTFIPTFGFPKKPRVVASLAKWFYGSEELCLSETTMK